MAPMLTAIRQNAPKIPFTVDINKREGYIGEFILAADGAFQDGVGPNFGIKFQVSGTSPTGVESTRNGYITLSTSEWGTFGRPDHGHVTFVFDGSAAHTYMYNTPTFSYLDGINIAIRWLEKENAVGITVSMDKTLIKEICDRAIRGILYAHEKAADWAVGKVW
ncbi:hypothetical protein H2201_006003 [Coniosporium apollinis]|uniref:Uncharacterized protein n=1 Tax=Coniosporium apollinis TaxID=61459 RepID=A0ABQ9NTP2_9PEZI|nr:hypothetical protein H2201_006003 [Coniosporium apollinis]